VSAQEQREGAASTELVQRNEEGKLIPLPLHNGVMSPDKWTMFGRMAVTVADTEFVPKDLRKRPAAVMACLMYGDSLGLHPSVSLTDIYIANGRVGVSGALMLSKVREAGHKIKFEWIKDDDDNIIGCTAKGARIENGEVVDEDEWTYTLEDAKKAGLYPNSDARAAWMKTPHVMLRWRALSQLVRFLWPDLFRGGSVYVPDEAEEAAYSERQKLVNGAAPGENNPDDEVGTEYGSDPLLAAWLVTLFTAANDLEAGRWLPKKVKLALKGKTQEEREALAVEVATWIEEAGGIVPERPVEDDGSEPAGEGEYEPEGSAADDPGMHMNDDDVAETVVLD
jgi:hypothetical protein